MKTVLSYLLSPIYCIVFGLSLLIFHPIQMISLKIGGSKMHNKSVVILNYVLLYGLWILGCKISFKGMKQVPTDRPLIIVSNHQSLMDIPAVVIGFRKFSPKFVSKIELSKGIPSISYNLKHGGSALIDRKDPRQSIMEIMKLGRSIETQNHSACIFPEGTRSKTGRIRRFQHAGLASLIKYSPSAHIVPFVIDGNSELLKRGTFPLSFGTKLTFTALPAIDPKGRDIKELTQEIKQMIEDELNNK